MLLESIVPQLPTNPTEYAIFFSSIIGAVLLVYSQFIEAENRRDLVRMIAALALLVYAIWISNLIFIVTMLGVFVASVIEFLEIYMGYHHHTRKDVQVYEYIGRKKKE